MKIKIFTLILFMSIVKLSVAQDFILKTSNVQPGFKFQLQTFESNVTARVDWGDGSGIVDMGYVSGSGTYISAPNSLSGSKTIKVYCDAKINFFGFSQYQLDEFTVNSANPLLTGITINECQLQVLNVANATNLESLACTVNNLTALNLSANDNLLSLNLSNNSSLANLTVSSTLTSLTSITLNNTKLGDSDIQALLTKATKITDLTINNDLVTNKVTTLNLSNNKDLTSLTIMNNNLSGTLDLSALTKLQTVNLSNNNLEGLIVKSPVATDLIILNNKIEALDVTQAVQLNKLWAANNSLETLNLSNNININDISLDQNALTSLVLPSSITSLASLSLKNNNLKTLDINTSATIGTLAIDYNSFNFLTAPRVSTTTYTYTNQSAADSLAISVNSDKASIDLDNILTEVNGTVPGTSGQTSTAKWYRTLATTGATNAVPAAQATTSGTVTTFKGATLTGDYWLYAQLSNTAFPNLFTYTQKVKLNDPSVGIGSSEEDVQILFINQSTNQLIYNVTDAQVLYLYTLVGQVAQSQQLSANEGSINLDALPKGIYVAKIIKANGQSVSKKVVR